VWAYELSTNEMEVGTHTITVNATDLAGNPGEDSISLDVLEIVPPSVSIDSPGEGEVFRQGEILEVTGTATDNNQINTLTLTMAGEEFDLMTKLKTDDTWKQLVETSGMSEGDKIIKVEATDISGNQASTEVTIYLDNTAPTISIEAPRAKSLFVGGEMLIIKGLASDNVGIEKLKLFVDGEAPIEITSTLSQGVWEYRELNTAGWTSGKHTLKVKAIDMVGFEAEDTVTITVDNQEPSVDIVQIDDPIYVGHAVTFTGGAYDNLGIAKLEILIGQNIIELDITNRLLGNSWDFYWNTSGIDDGIYLVKVRITDTVGLQAEAMITIQITTPDTEVPVDDDDEDDDDDDSSSDSFFSGTNIGIIILLIIIGSLFLIAIIVFLIRNREEGHRASIGGPSRYHDDYEDGEDTEEVSEVSEESSSGEEPVNPKRSKTASKGSKKKAKRKKKRS